MLGSGRQCIGLNALTGHLATWLPDSEHVRLNEIESCSRWCSNASLLQAGWGRDGSRPAAHYWASTDGPPIIEPSGYNYALHEEDYRGSRTEDWEAGKHAHLQEMAQQVAQVAEAGIGGVLHRLQPLLPAELRQLAAPEPQQGPHQGYPRPPAASA